VVASFRTAFGRWGTPAGVLTDNGAVFTAKQRGQGRVALEIELGLLGVKVSHSRPYHPQTCGKVERFHQTQKKWLTAQPRTTTVRGLQRQLDRFARYYNTIRPHRALHRRTPPRPMRLDLKPSRPARSFLPTIASGTTKSTAGVRSPSATTAGYTTSASASGSPAPRSACSSMICTSASSTATPAP
jgi:hypothetical protein